MACHHKYTNTCHKYSHNRATTLYYAPVHMVDIRSFLVCIRGMMWFLCVFSAEIRSQMALMTASDLVIFVTKIIGTTEKKIREIIQMRIFLSKWANYSPILNKYFHFEKNCRIFVIWSHLGNSMLSLPLMLGPSG